MKKIIFNHNFVNGWGDTFLCIFDILNCIDYLKQNFNDFEIIYTINDVYNINTLDKVLNLNFLNQFVDKFEILVRPEILSLNNGYTEYKNKIYKRIYSGRNYDVTNNVPGAFDVFIDESDFDEINSRKIPFIDFTFNDVDDRPKNFNIFNDDLVYKCDEFINNNFNNEFDSIYYRSLNPIDEKKMDWFVKKLEETIDINQTYFMCSNSSVVKKKLLESKIKIKLFRDLDNHDLHHVPNGFVYLGQSIDDAIFAVTELIILSRGKHIYYSGEVNNISLFNWYAINIKKVKLINI
jgi:hypothetical protein